MDCLRNICINTLHKGDDDDDDDDYDDDDNNNNNNNNNNNKGGLVRRNKELFNGTTRPSYTNKKLQEIYFEAAKH
jgi:hypothetical protein